MKGTFRATSTLPGRTASGRVVGLGVGVGVGVGVGLIESDGTVHGSVGVEVAGTGDGLLDTVGGDGSGDCAGESDGLGVGIGFGENEGDVLGDPDAAGDDVVTGRVGAAVPHGESTAADGESVGMPARDGVAPASANKEAAANEAARAASVEPGRASARRGSDVRVRSGMRCKDDSAVSGWGEPGSRPSAGYLFGGTWWIGRWG
jgi:hypothetical protein